LEESKTNNDSMEFHDRKNKAITAIKEALAQTQEPWCMKMNGCKTKCEDCPDEPPQRKPLTENAIKHLWYEACQTNLELTSQLIVHLVRNIEAAHGIKENT